MEGVRDPIRVVKQHKKLLLLLLKRANNFIELLRCLYNIYAGSKLLAYNNNNNSFM